MADLLRAERLAAQMLLKGWDGSLPVDPLALLQRCRDTRVMTVQEAQGMLTDLLMPLESMEGITIRGERDGRTHYLVIYQAAGSRERRRFSIAHELGHRTLDHHGGKGTVDGDPEAEANRFASSLLCPAGLLHLMMEEMKPLYLEQIAWVCGISKAAARMTWAQCAAAHPWDGAVADHFRAGLRNRMQKIPLPQENWENLTQGR